MHAQWEPVCVLTALRLKEFSCAAIARPTERSKTFLRRINIVAAQPLIALRITCISHHLQRLT